jgi:hypothetical protein
MFRIETIYFKQLGRERPDKIMTIDDIAAAQLAKKQAKGRIMTAQAAASAGAGHPIDRTPKQLG